MQLAEVPEEAREAAQGKMLLSVPEEPAIAQAWIVYARLLRTLADQGLGPECLVRQRVFVTDAHDIAPVERVMDLMLGAALPATSIVVVPARGLEPGMRVFIDAIASSEPISSGSRGASPRPSRYPEAIRIGSLLFLSAIHGVADDSDPDSDLLPASVQDRLGTAVSGSHETYAQTARIFRRMAEVLSRHEAGLDDLVRLNGWTSFPMRDYQPVVLVREALIRTALGRHASTGLTVRGVAPDEALLAFDGIAVRGGAAAVDKKVIKTDASDIADYYVGAVQGGQFVFTSGEVPIDTTARKCITNPSDLEGEGQLLSINSIRRGRSVEAQSWYTYGVLRSHLSKYGLTLKHVCHQTVYLKDVSELPTLERLADRIFDGSPPPTTVIPIDDTSPFPEAGLEIEFIASAPA